MASSSETRLAPLLRMRIERAVTQREVGHRAFHAWALDCPLNFFARIRKSSTRPEPINRANSSGGIRFWGMAAGFGVSWRRQDLESHEKEKRRFSIFMFLSLGKSLCD